MNLEPLDLTTYARHSLNYLTRMNDPGLKHLPYWKVYMMDRPAHAQHCRVDDAEICASWAKALLAVRLMLDTDEGREVNEEYVDYMLLNCHEDDGLSYAQPFPWTVKEHYANIHEQAWVLDALVFMYQQTCREDVKVKIDRLIEGLHRVAVKKRTRYFWHGSYDMSYKSYHFAGDNYFKAEGAFDMGKWSARAEEETRNGDLILGLVEYYELTGSERAMELAEGLVNFVVFDSRKFGYESAYIGHVHAAMWCVNGVLRYGLVAKRDDLVQWARKAWDFTFHNSSSFGWVPEYVQRKHPSLEVCETCCIADMIRGALFLAEAGYDEYWDHVDRFTRNHLLANQIRDTSFMTVDNERTDTEAETWKELDQRMRGAFSGGTDPNFFGSYHFRAAAGCCGATGAWSFYYVWNAITEQRDDAILVNLPMSRSTDWIDVESRSPAEGALILRAKSSKPIHVRIPTYGGQRVGVTRNGRAEPVIWADGRVLLATPNPGDEWVVHFDEPEYDTRETIASVKYDVCWKGHTVLHIMPKGSSPESANAALYQRAPVVDYEPSRL